LIGVCLVRNLASRQRGWLVKEREGADALAASETRVVKPKALLEKRDHARVAIEIALGIDGVLPGHDRIQPAECHFRSPPISRPYLRQTEFRNRANCDIGANDCHNDAPMNNCGKSATSALRCIGRLPIQQNIVHPDFHRDFHVRVRQNIEAPVLHRVDRDPCDVGGG
jgi:hypothetical protein